MTAIILGWNPERWNAWNYESVEETVAGTGRYRGTWRVGRHRNIPAGADAWLLLQGGHGRGLIGHGVVASEAPEPGAHPAEPGKTAMYVQVDFDALLPLGGQIAAEVLKEAVPGVPWGGVFGSSLAVKPAEEAKIRALWSEYGPPPGPDPTLPVPGTFPGYALSRVDVNRYERSPDARRACIAHHGTNCAACGFSFEIAYGELGKDFIQVHHIVPPAQLGSGYELDPVADLVPLCANCHAMAHRGVRTARTVAELRRIMGAAGFLSGHAVSPEELEAQRDARRILEQH